MKAEILKGKRVMVVEDDYIQSGDIAQTLISQGADVVVFDDVRSALGFLGNNFVDIALLDVQLGRELSYPIADEFLRLCIPFLLLSGHKQADVPARFAHVPFVGKPCSHEELVALMISTVHGNELTF
ncbi:response regulator [uncultured Agrobacterium sp.]|uniref:response regulator n=1 Tax=uncultured Agrobacterium sp. TaxID=157277 RepID=UPI00138F7D49|nr:response regulator [uncultured Agrobacterium sp.]